MKVFDEKYNCIPKAELHCHLGGSIRTSTIIDIARKNKLRIPSFEEEQLNRHVKVTRQLKDLQSVLDAFSIARNCFVDGDAVERIAYEVFEDAAAQNVKLFELRFSPDWAFSGHQLDWDDALMRLEAARHRAERNFDMAIGFISISSRAMGLESCTRTIDWTIKWRDRILGVDLADAELQNPIAEFKKEVLRAREAGLRVTVHSGEDTPASAVRDTIFAVCPDRIGHGIHIIQDMSVVDLVREREIYLEVCPWSNYLTNAVRTIESHPLKKLFDLGVKVTINSDDPEVLDTNLNNEYRIATEILGFTMEEVMETNKNAFEASFLSKSEKDRLWNKYFLKARA